MKITGFSDGLKAQVIVVAFVIASLAAAPLLIGAAEAEYVGPAGGDMDYILSELEKFALDEMAKAQIYGMAYAVVHDGEVVYSKGHGVLYKDSGRFVDERTLFEIGSCTKAFNGALMGTVVDDGSVKWDDKVVNLMPKFKMYDRWVTKHFQVKDLMAQRSGMPAYALDMMSSIGFGREDIKRAIQFVEPITSFRADYAYQNNLHLWAAQLVEIKTGLSWEEAMKRRLLQKMGMDESTLDPAENDANPNHAKGHLWDEASKSFRVIPSDWQYRGWLEIYAPAGGIYSNVSDMSRWLLFLLGEGSFDGRQIVTRETAHTLIEPRVFMHSVPPNTTMSYCTGWLFQTTPPSPYWWHNGGTPGMHSIVSIYPQGRLGLVVLTNNPSNSVPELMTAKLHSLYFGSTPSAEVIEAMASLKDSPDSTRSGDIQESAAALELGRYAGTFHNPAYGKAVVKRSGDALVFSIGPVHVTGPMVPTGGHSFRFDFPDWPGQALHIDFRVDASGNVNGMTMRELSDVKKGLFKRVG